MGQPKPTNPFLVWPTQFDPINTFYLHCQLGHMFNITATFCLMSPMARCRRKVTQLQSISTGLMYAMWANDFPLWAGPPISSKQQTKFERFKTQKKGARYQTICGLSSLVWTQCENFYKEKLNTQMFVLFMTKCLGTSVLSLHRSIIVSARCWSQHSCAHWQSYLSHSLNTSDRLWDRAPA